MDPLLTRGAASADWYRDRRRQLEARAVDARVVPESAVEHRSPSGRYRLTVSLYDMGPGGWDYSRGVVADGTRPLAVVKRNLGTFHFGWAEGHANGHDYLLCGEDYQGQTVVELDTGRRADYMPDDARRGGGFCPAAYHPSPDGQWVVVDGCYWGCPYQLVLCRFDEPMALPWPEVDRVDQEDGPMGWAAEGFAFESRTLVRLSDGRPVDELDAAESDAVVRRRTEVGGIRTGRHLWTASGERRSLGDRVDPCTS